jgi:sterol desaturase/sphingolipid hydroxylase (fatty acid hydroxylase superfamily)
MLSDYLPHLLGGSMKAIEFFSLAIIPYVLHDIVFWGYSLYIYYKFDEPDKPTAPFKRQKSIRITQQEYKNCVKSVLFNQVVFLLPFATLQAPFLKWSSPQLAAFAKAPFAWHGLPNPILAFFQLLGAYVFVEIGFYYTHRLLVRFYYLHY